jgi:hypothetical protein
MRSVVLRILVSTISFVVGLILLVIAENFFFPSDFRGTRADKSLVALFSGCLSFLYVFSVLKFYYSNQEQVRVGRERWLWIARDHVFAFLRGRLRLFLIDNVLIILVVNGISFLYLVGDGSLDLGVAAILVHLTIGSLLSIALGYIFLEYVHPDRFETLLAGTFSAPFLGFACLLLPALFGICRIQNMPFLPGYMPTPRLVFENLGVPSFLQSVEVGLLTLVLPIGVLLLIAFENFRVDTELR